MAEWFNEYWYLALIFVAVCVVAAFVFYFAGKSYKRYRTSYRNQEAEIKHLLALKEKYVPLTQKAIAESDSSETLEGVALSYQVFLQKKDDMEKEFMLLSEEKRYIYILDVFTQEKSVQDFFSENGDILRMEITKALLLIGMKDFADRVEKVRLMYDDKDLTTSWSQAEIDRLQTFADENDILSQIKLAGAEYIKNNSQLFVN
ncbi:MAG: hypothetical protein IJN68_00130 [Clostridia bacterium]|nr:hypothetical protein [Oscillospiraceae bacterium]MBQ7004816.1 hypothetical protein [Clostridia bacterium]